MSLSTSEPASKHQSIDAFLLTRQWRDSAKGIVLDFWFASDNGPIHVLIENQQAIFFICQADRVQVSHALSALAGVSIKDLKLKTFSHQAVAGVYFNSQQSLYQARDILKQLDISHYEADIRPVERYLTERFLSGPVSIYPNTASSGHKSSGQLFLNPKIKPLEKVQEQSLFKVMSLDIETAYDSQDLYSISLLCEGWHIILMLGTGENDTKDIEYYSSEQDLMLAFIEYIAQQDPDIFIGWNVINFDFIFLQKKADSLKISLAIGRAESLPVWRKAQTEQSHYFLLIPGRVVLDGIDTLKSATWNFPSFSLEAVGNELLGRGKLIKKTDPKKSASNYDPLSAAKEIKRLFHEDKLALAAYNLEDCQLVIDIFHHTHLIDFVIERARLTGLEMDRTGGSVAAFDNQYLPRLHRKGFVAPDIHDRDENISAPGGYVMNSKPGIYDSVLVLDYKSLYPSIIRTFRVDPYARVKAQKLDAADCVPGFNGISFARDDFILPDIIKSLWQARDQAKKDHNSALSQAIKIIMNSFYGVLGTAGCRVHDARLTSSITLRGHELMKQTATMIEAEGYQVIYGDTDSVFVSLGGAKEKTIADKIGQQLITKINLHWKNELQEKYHIESFLEMEYETHYIRFFMPTIRGSDQGSKKRYAGMIQTINNGEVKNKIIFKGLETVRTDWTALSREVQQEIYQRIFNDLPYEAYLKDIIQKLKQGDFDDQLIYRKRLRQKLSDYKKNIPPHAQAALKAEAYAIADSSKEANHDAHKNRYEYGGLIDYVITTRGLSLLNIINIL
ncbi:DNA polymerase II [sulfur-oxidizing endosymbiont of Gigantopelta aegis]|uniref:DNA polymerase II n=1 Tax=sulfur-oxidizing endosymbiont of Gigantopelta aegis TaxID=2794934 RepID=UPI001FEAA618|nr:DNA polymerase II [sulfur-oxidizing endosymbiont of Gigantopelta aegis]